MPLSIANMIGMAGGGGALFSLLGANPNLALEALTPNAATATSIATDDFTRTASTSVLGSTLTGGKTWATDLGTCGINGNKAYASALGTNSRAIAHIDTLNTDDTFSVDVLIVNNVYSGIALRIVDGSNYIAVGLSNFGVRVSKVVAGTNTNVTSFGPSTTIGTTHTLTVRIVGANISVAVDGVLSGVYPLTAGEQTTFSASTLHGLMFNSTSTRLSNFSATTATNRLGLPINSWYDMAGKSTVSQSNITYTPVLQLDAGGVQVVRNVTSGALDVVMPSHDAGEITILGVGKMSASDLTSTQRIITLGGVSGNSLQFNNGQLMAVDAAPWYSGIPAPTVNEIFGMIGSTSGFPVVGPGVKMFGHNGCMVFRRGSAASGPQSWRSQVVTAGILFGRGAAQGSEDFLGDLVYLEEIPRPISDSDLTQAKQQLVSKFSVPADSPATLNLLHIGDSLTTGSLGSGVVSTGSFPDRVANALTEKYKIWNLAVHSQTAQTAFGDIPAFATLYDLSCTRNVAVVWIGTNDVFSAPGAPATAFNKVKSICSLLKAAGFTVLVMDMLPRGATVSSQFETDRVAFNNLGLADFTVATADPLIWRPGAGGTYADLHLHIGGDANVGLAGSQNGANFQGDHTHLTTAGDVYPATLLTTGLGMV